MTLEEKVAVPAGKVLIMETRKVDTGKNLSCGEGTITLGTDTESATLEVASGATVAVDALNIPSGSKLNNNGGTITVAGKLYSGT